MKANKLKGKRIEMGFTQSEIADLIEKSIDAYAKKERGETGFSPTEIAILTITLMLSYAEFNEIFFDGRLPFGNFVDVPSDGDG